MATKVYDNKERAEAGKAQAESFVDNVLDDPERASEIADMSLEDWLEETGRRIANPKHITRRKNMATRKAVATKDDLLDEVETLRAENETLRDQVGDLSERLDQVYAIASPDDEDDELDEEEDDDESEEEDDE